MKRILAAALAVVTLVVARASTALRSASACATDGGPANAAEVAISAPSE